MYGYITYNVTYNIRTNVHQPQYQPIQYTSQDLHSFIQEMLNGNK